MTDSTEAMASGSQDEEPPPPPQQTGPTVSMKQILTRMNTDPPTYEDVLTTGNSTNEASTSSETRPPIFPSYPNAGNITFRDCKTGLYFDF